MKDWIFLINYIMVSFFGCILSAAFCKIGGRRKSWLIVLAATALALALQGVEYWRHGLEAIRSIYPLVTHLPLFLALWYVSGRAVGSITAVLTAYFCCQLRRWLALFAVWAFGGNGAMQPVAEILITIPLLFLLLRFAAPKMRQMIIRPSGEAWPFAIIPALYYLFDYITTVYTELLYSGNPIVAEFMPFVCCAAYLFFVNKASEDEKARYFLELERESLNMQTKQSLREIEALRRSQVQAAEYRHDLRHHLQYLSGCMENGQLEQGQAYIHSICDEIAAQTVTQYCENETVNLVLSAYAERADKESIPMEVAFSLGSFPLISANDLCVLLSNALENALNECKYLKQHQKVCKIEVTGYERGNKLAFQIANTCREDVSFRRGLPVTDRPGHGTGTRSISSVVEKYGGVCSFSVKDDTFILRVSI